MDAVLALGSNVGDRLGHLRRGLDVLARAAPPERVSSVYASAAVGYPEQPEFLNAVVLARTALTPRELLALAVSAEEEEGRVRSFRNAPRTLDVDLVFYGDLVVDEEDLVIPHPRWRERSFVLAPLAEVAPAYRPPGERLTTAERWRLARSQLPEVREVAGPDAIWRGTS